MTAPVRLRGEVGERRKRAYFTTTDGLGGLGFWTDGDGQGKVILGKERRRRLDRRQSPSTAARIDAIILATREPLLRALEEAQVRIASLEGRVQGLQEALELNLARYRAEEGSYDDQ